MLTLQGERKQEKNKRFHRIERAYGSFVRIFRVPDNVDEASVTAEFKGDMLNATLPKSKRQRASQSM